MIVNQPIRPMMVMPIIPSTLMMGMMMMFIIPSSPRSSLLTPSESSHPLDTFLELWKLPSLISQNSFVKVRLEDSFIQVGGWVVVGGGGGKGGIGGWVDIGACWFFVRRDKRY